LVVKKWGGPECKGVVSLCRKRLLTGVHIHPKVFVSGDMDRLRSVMVTMTGEQHLMLR
jgi:hypothetical protein